jgi:hypothetical protein
MHHQKQGYVLLTSPLKIPVSHGINLDVILQWSCVLECGDEGILTCPVMDGARGGVVVKALRYRPAGRGFDSRWCHWNFSVT